jgi:4,5-DOPA dioxygenase extradiol
MKSMPVLFAAHGSPMNALANNAFTKSLNELGQQLPRPQAILCVSAHWETQGTQILAVKNPQTIHDFYGFPKPLFEVQYPAPGSLELANEVQNLIPGSTLSDRWGFDHGTWSVLVHLYPKADIPVIQLSLDTSKTPDQHLEVGKLLQPLREKNILIMGSGNIVHNLRKIQWQNPNGALDWAKEFDQDIKLALEKHQQQDLTHYEEKFGEAAHLSVPTNEHYLPFLYCVGAAATEDKISYPYEGYEMGSLSMRSVLWEKN